MHRNLLYAGALAALAARSTAGPSSRRRVEGLGKWKDGPSTEVDCSLAAHDYEYYMERCWDELTMWWVNGRCIGGKKEEISELHRCHIPDGTRQYCHDCNDGSGNIKNVCGSDNPDKDEVCELAWMSEAKDCGDQGLTVYSHQCTAPSGESTHWYLRESFQCDKEKVSSMGPCGEDVPATFTCGEEWYYPFEPDDASIAANYPDLVGLDHAFVSASNRFCLDCGLAVQVCASTEEATCESLGLPAKGMPFTTTAAPYVAPPALWSLTPEPTEETTTEADGDEPSSSSSPNIGGLGKYDDGPPTDYIDCSIASHDFDYYIERCYDDITQWWVNGRCIGGIKQEVSELHRCMKPNGSRKYCHDCDDGSGNIKNVCGSDNPNKDEVCAISWAATAKDCGDQGLTVYSHQCVALPEGGDDDDPAYVPSTTHWYLRESFWCDEEAVYSTGPCGDPDKCSVFTCGEGWYYPFESDDPTIAANYPDLAGEEHAFSTSTNGYCLDCGFSIQVCASSDMVSCESLGLPEKGSDAYVATKTTSTTTTTASALDTSSTMTTYEETATTITTTTTEAQAYTDEIGPPASEEEEEASPKEEEVEETEAGEEWNDARDEENAANDEEVMAKDEDAMGEEDENTQMKEKEEGEPTSAPTLMSSSPSPKGLSSTAEANAPPPSSSALLPFRRGVAVVIVFAGAAIVGWRTAFIM